MEKQWKAKQTGFKASEATKLINDKSSTSGAALKDFFFPDAPPNHTASARSDLLSSGGSVEGKLGPANRSSHQNLAQERSAHGGQHLAESLGF